MFNVGDKIVYPMHGAGTIYAIEKKNILNEEQDYYIISMPGEVKVMVPTQKAEEIGVRSIIDKNDVSKVLNILEEDETEMSDNWNKRYRDNMDKMKSGDIYEVADVVRNLSFKQKEKGLSTGDKKMLLKTLTMDLSTCQLAELFRHNFCSYIVLVNILMLSLYSCNFVNNSFATSSGIICLISSKVASFSSLIDGKALTNFSFLFSPNPFILSKIELNKWVIKKYIIFPMVE